MIFNLICIDGILSAGVFVKFVLPAIIIACVAGVLAFFLAYLGTKMTVERDARIDDVKRHLSGANCGGCGYPGCEAFAEALVKGETTLAKCNATSKQGKENIARILNLTLEQSKKTVAVVHCNGGNACKNKYDYQGYGDCVSAEILAGGNKACETGCMGLGSCVAACKYNAISVSKDRAVAKVDYAHCTSCGACVSTCPKHIIGRIPTDAAVYVACSNLCRGKEVMGVCEKGCIACGRCEKNCPTQAIKLSNNLAVIDYDKCIKCGNCMDVCPRKCILPFPKERPLIAEYDPKASAAANK